MGHWKQKKNNFICGFLSPERNKCQGQYLVHFAACPRDSIRIITAKRATEKGRTSCLHKGLHELGTQVNRPRQNWRKGILSFLQITQHGYNVRIKMQSNPGRFGTLKILQICEHYKKVCYIEKQSSHRGHLKAPCCQQHSISRHKWNSMKGMVWTHMNPRNKEGSLRGYAGVD